MIAIRGSSMHRRSWQIERIMTERFVARWRSNFGMKSRMDMLTTGDLMDQLIMVDFVINLEFTMMVNALLDAEMIVESRCLPSGSEWLRRELYSLGPSN